MIHCTETVPTVVEARQVHEVVPACHRHIVASAGNSVFWTLCGQFIPLRRLRIIRVDRTTRTMQIRDEEQHVEPWDWWDCHRACGLEHLRRKQQYRIGTGCWSWLWHPAETEVAPAEEAPARGSREWRERRLAELGIQTAAKARTPSWWRRLLRRKERAA